MATPQSPPATVHIDGAARGNPGPAAYALSLQRPGQPVIEAAQPMGTATNNVAEYTALVRALEVAAEQGIRELQVFSDSELLVKQMNGEYRVKSPDLQELYREASALRKEFDRVTLTHVRRSENSRADFLCNEALDGRPRQAGAAVASVPVAPRPLGTPPREKRAAPTPDLQSEAVAFLTAVAQAWTEQGVSSMPVPVVWERLWELLDEHGALKKRK
ncbi:MAG: ribonuclease HI family protein [Bacteroidales bacterium]|nr:ribonuclease HI family protein [Bacteroidales bacterium]